MSRRREVREHAPMALHHVDVTAVRDVTPRMRRITVAGPSLAHFVDDGPDQRFKLFLPRPGQDRPPVTAAEDWYADWQALSDDVRPVMRTYTIRAARPQHSEVDFDIVLHGDSGPGSAWAERVQLGDRVAVFGAYAEYCPPEDADWQLLVGDETALPAIAAAAERLPAGAYARIIVEVAEAAERQTLLSDAKLDVTWISRADTPENGEPLLVTAVREIELPPGHGYAWVAGEATAVTAVRRHLINDRGLTAEHITFMGYWRRGASIDPT